jgi:hypothetical protein
MGRGTQWCPSVINKCNKSENVPILLRRMCRNSLAFSHFDMEKIARVCTTAVNDQRKKL